MGSPNPAGDEDQLADMDGLIASVLAQLLGAGTNIDPAGNATNVAAILAARTAAALAPGTSGGVLTSSGTSSAPTFQPPLGMQFLTGGGTLTAATVTAAQSAGFQGIFLDPRFVWDASGLVLRDVSNFTIESRMAGSIGYNGAISYNATGYVKTDTGTPADGIQIYSDGTTPTQGVVLRGLALAGANPNAVVHFGGRQRRCGMEHCFAYNTGTAATTVAAGSNGAAASSFTGSQSLSVASSASFPSGGGQVLVATSTGLALITYTGTGTGTLTGCTAASSSSGTLATGGAVQLLSAAVVVDTVLSGSPYFNSEDQFFSHCSFATSSAGTAVGIDVNSPAQHANDTLWNDITTASAGLASVTAIAGGGHNFFNYYDRSAAATAPAATVWNHGAQLIFTGGEDQNNAAAGVAHLLDGSSARTIIQSRNLSVGTNSGNVASVVAGSYVARGRCRWSGTLAVSGGNLDLNDVSGSFGALTVSGSSGTLLLAGTYTPDSGPVVSSWTGTTSYPATAIDTTAGDIQPTSTAASAGNKGQAADAKHVHAQNYGGVFGDGSDGSVTFDGTTTILGLAPSSSTYTMTRDIFCTSITINNGVTVLPNGWRIFCQGTVTNNGTIAANGGSAAAAAAGASPFTSTAAVLSGNAGAAGGTGAGAQGSNTGLLVGVGTSGSGGSGSGGAGGSAVSVRAGSSTGLLKMVSVALTATMSWASVGALRLGGAGGGGSGGGDGTGSGGGGGGGGGVVVIVAWAVSNAGTISATGGNGGNGGGTNCGGGGGGGGGLILAYTLSAWTAGTTTLTGGSGGTKTGTGVAGNTGNTGSAVNVIVS